MTERKTIRQLREELSWAQLDVAVRVGASVAAVYKWERGLVIPRPKYQQRLATLFGVSITDIALGPIDQEPRDRPQSRPDGPGAAPMAEPTRQPKTTIRQLRQARGWTQEVLAGRLRVGSTTVARWEGGRVPPPDQQQRLADLFGVSVEAIAFGPAEQPQDRP